MKLPKTVQICGREFKIEEHKNMDGANFSNRQGIIRIGTKYPKDVPNCFLHEVIEAIFTERGMRWKLYEDARSSDYLFSFKHEEYQNAVMDIAVALKDYLK